MKVIVLHGDDSQKSFIRLNSFRDEAKKRGWEYHKVSDTSSNIPEILSGQNLFISEKLVVISEPKLVNKRITDWIIKKGESYKTTLVIYSDKKLPVTFIKSLPKDTKVEERKLPTKLWTMLDSFYPGNAKVFLKLLHEVAETEPIEFIFSLLIKQVKEMYWILVDERTFPQSGWRVSKLKSKGNKFGKEKLEFLISEFAAIDVKSKTTDSNLLDLLDFVIITELE